MIFKNGLVLGIGEILWDLLPEGRQLGGAPANFAFHCRQLGAATIVASSVGGDIKGARIKDFLAWNLLGDLVQTDHHRPTGTVEVTLDENGIPSYKIIEDVAWDYIQYNTAIGEIAKTADVICFGSLAQRHHVSRNTILRVLKESKENCLKIFDINLRQNFYDNQILTESLGKANVLKINEEEFNILIDIFGLNADQDTAAGSMIEKFNLKVLALTAGEKGSYLYKPKEKSFIRTPEVKVVDTVGAGDAFTAAMAVGLYKDLPLKKIHEGAVKLSAYVCTRQGATPEHDNLKIFN
jgi:fructokinase